MADGRKVWVILRKLPLPETERGMQIELSTPRADTNSKTGLQKQGLNPLLFVLVFVVVLVYKIWKSGGSPQEITKW